MDQWKYTDSSGTEKGPIPEPVLCKLLEKGTGLVDGSTLVWREGMQEWKPMLEMPVFKLIIEAANQVWYYVDSANQQRGPIVTRGIVDRATTGDIDGLTLVWNSTMPSWLPLGEVPELKAKLQQAASEQELLEEPQADLGVFNQDMVYIDDSVQPKLELPKKTIIGDDGVQYVFNEETQEWVEGEGDAEDSDEEDPYKRKLAKKRKQAQALAMEEDKASEDGDDASQATEEEEHEENASTATEEEDGKKKKKKKKSKKKRGLEWNEKAQNNWIYVTGLPTDITEEELIAHFSRAGVFAINPATALPKIKLYRDEQQVPKGDASLCYARTESVETCVEYFDGGFIRPNFKLEVKRAEFNKRDGDHQPRSKLNVAQLKVAKAAMKQALAWVEEDDTGVQKATALKIVVIENMFRPEEFKNPSFVGELEQDIASECGKLGPLEKITVFEKNPRGVVIVKFGTAYAASECLRVFNGRFFSSRRLRCYYWDGVTDFTVKDEKEDEERLEELGNWIDGQELPDEFQLRVEGES